MTQEKLHERKVVTAVATTALAAIYMATRPSADEEKNSTTVRAHVAFDKAEAILKEAKRRGLCPIDAMLGEVPAVES